MGRERIWTGKHVFLYLTCWMTMLNGIAGCIHFPSQRQEGEKHLAIARTLMVKGDYEASLAENEEVVSLFPQSLGDRALYQIGLIHIHPENPRKDYYKSLECFQTIIKDYPGSIIKGEATILIEFLEKTVNNQKKIEELYEKINLLENSIQKKMKRIRKLRSRLGVLHVQKKKLESQIESLKQIDIGIEEKKRED